MNNGEIYELVNRVLSPWLIAGLGLLQLYQAWRLGRRWRVFSLALVGVAGAVTAIIYLLFGFDVLIDFFIVRVSGRIAIFLLLLFNNLFLAAASAQIKEREHEND